MQVHLHNIEVKFEYQGREFKVTVTGPIEAKLNSAMSLDCHVFCCHVYRRVHRIDGRWCHNDAERDVRGARCAAAEAEWAPRSGHHRNYISSHCHTVGHRTRRLYQTPAMSVILIMHTFYFLFTICNLHVIVCLFCADCVSVVHCGTNNIMHAIKHQ